MQRFFLFSFIFLLSFVSHSIYWYRVDFFDKSEWLIQQKLFSEQISETRHSLFYGYPATPFLMLGLIMPLNTSLALLVSLGAAGAVVVSHILRPNSLWYLGVAGIILFHPLYAASTPPSAIVAPWLALLVLYTLSLYEQSLISFKKMILWGLLAGFCVAIRWDISAALASFLLLFLIPKLRGKVIFVFLAATISFIIFDPYMWFMPIAHVIDLASKLTTHFYTINAPLPLLTLLTISLPTLISIFVCLLTRALPRTFTVWLLLSTVVIFFVLLQSSYQPRWYFYPLLLVWELFLPLCILEALKNKSRVFHLLIISGFILGYSVL